MHFMADLFEAFKCKSPFTVKKTRNGTILQNPPCVLHRKKTNGLERHESEQIMTEVLFLGELLL